FGQRPLPAGEVGRSEWVFGDLPRDRLARVIGWSFDTDEGNPVGTGDSAKAHVLTLVAAVMRACGPLASHMLEYRFSMVRHVCDYGRMAVESISTARRWSMLAIALTATTCANVFINGAAFLIPTLHTERGLDLAQAGLLSSMPSFGLV